VVSVALTEGDVEHLCLFKGLFKSRKQRSYDKLEVIWFSIITTIWKARNAIIFIMRNVNWEKAAEDPDFIFEDFEIKIEMF
jgi:hypothetical protein